MLQVTRRRVSASGHLIAIREAGPADGAPVILLHGLASDSETWDRVVPLLAEHGLRVVAVDLLGHGDSDKPATTYLLDDFAGSLRDLLDTLGIDRATVCGHSLGGAIAIHFGHLYPARLQRLVLVAAGGLGKQVHPVLRAASLPAAPGLLRLVTGRRLRELYASPALHRRLRLTEDNVTNLRRAGRTLGSREGQAAFFASLRGVVGPAGQRGSFLEMRTLRPDLPTLLVWNAGDPVIPLAHARAAAAYLDNGRLVVFPGAGHEPHRREPQRFADEIATFVAQT